MSRAAEQQGTAGALDTRQLLAGLRDALAADHPPQARLDQVVRLIARATGAEVCSLYLLRAGEVLELFATIGLNQKAVHLTRLRVSEGLIGRIAANAAPLAVEDAPHHPAFAYRPETGEDPFHSLCGVPLIRSGKVRGVLAIQHRERHVYGAELVETLQTIAMVLAELVAGGEFVAVTESLLMTEEAFGPARLEGMTFNPGMAMGRAILHRSEISVDRLLADNPGHEVKRLNEALAAMHASLDTLLRPSGNEAQDEVLEAYRMIATDRGWIGRINEAIRSGLSAEAAVMRVAEQIKSRLSASNDAYLRDRLTDFDDLSRRLLQHLLRPADAFRSAPIPDDAILVARHLGPAELLDIPSGKLKAVVLEEGAQTSHVVIVARALGIPVVGQCNGVLNRIAAGDDLLVDGDNALIMLRPSEDVATAFAEGMAIRADRARVHAEVRTLPSVTADGVGISLNLNCGLLLDVAQLELTRADGIGLYRTEIPFLARSDFPDVGAQTEIYRKVLDQAGGRSVTFRTLDVGGDKFLPYMTHPVEMNPALGWRSIRIGLDRPFLLRHQIRALLRAAAGRNLRLMFPMVSEVAEFVQARKLVDKELDRAAGRGQELPAKIETGTMLEVPALLFQLPALLRQADFISIGSNDLMQFVFAADRGNSSVTNRYDVLSPAALTLLRQVAQIVTAAGKPLTLCGEMAAHPLDAMALIGLGYRSLSLSAGAIDRVKLMLRSLHVGTLRAFLDDRLDGENHSLRPLLSAFARDHDVHIGDFH
jgi:phosphotransferase system enzyme I (PtsP)